MIRGLAALAALAALVPVGVSAQTHPWDTPGQDGYGREARTGASVELGFWTAGTTGALGAETRSTAVSGLLRVGVVVEEVLELSAVAAWSWGELQGSLGPVSSRTDAASAANPILSAALVAGEERWRLRVGGGVALPFAPAEGSARTALFYGGAMRGLSEVWLWAPNRLSLVPWAVLEGVPVEYLYLEGGLRVGVLFPVEDSPALLGDRSGEVDLAIEAVGAVGFRHENVLAAVRLRAVALPTVGTDELQTSAELVLRATGGVEPVELFGEARLTANLDEDLGFAFDEGKVWGFFLVFGAGAVP